MEKYRYYSLIRKEDKKEVYTSPDYTIEGCDNVIDFKKVTSVLKFYFDRVNSGIKQQMENPKLTDEQKSTLKLITPADYTIAYVENKELGCMFQRFLWEIEASKWIK